MPLCDSKLTTDGHKASRCLSVTAELLVLSCYRLLLPSTRCHHRADVVCQAWVFNAVPWLVTIPCQWVSGWLSDRLVRIGESSQRLSLLLSARCCACNNSNNNNNSKTMFTVLSSWQNHCESSPGSFDKCRTAPSGRRPKTKPDDLGCESACTGC